LNAPTLLAPDISAYRRGNAGIDYVIRLDSGKAGPNVVITALVHGNEICGAVALDRLLRRDIRPQLGALTMVFANVAAYESFDPDNPVQSRFIDEDMNRLWSATILDGARQSVELARARALRPLIDAADYLLDIHSMRSVCQPMMLAGPRVKGAQLAARLGVPAHVVRDFGPAGGVRLRDYGGFADPDSRRNALLIECGPHWADQTGETATEMALAFLVALGLIDTDAALEVAPAAPGTMRPPQRFIEVTRAVTATTERFRFIRPFSGLETILKAGTIIAEDGGAPVTTPYDACVLVLPAPEPVRGQTAVRFGRYLAGADFARPLITPD
jgi:predicted deacylase